MSYRFSTAAQWSACLFDQVDRDARADSALRPFAPYAQPPKLEQSRGAFAPAVTRTGEVLWHDEAGSLVRLPACADTPEIVAAPFALGHAARIVASSSGLWVASDSSEPLQRYEEDTLARLLAIQLPDARVIDISGDGRDGVFVLVERDSIVQSTHVDRGGHLGEPVTFAGITHAIAFTYLRRSDRFVVLSGEPGHYQRLHWLAARSGKSILTIPLGTLRPCFAASILGSDSRNRVFIAGDGFVLRLDADGNHLGDVPLDTRDTPVTGIAANRDGLLVTGPRGLLRFTVAEGVPDGAGEARFTILTAMLRSPDREDARRWLRVEASATLPEGATIEISFAATDDADLRKRMLAIASDESISASRRVQKLRGEPDLWRTPAVFHGSSAQAQQTFAAPLFDVREQYLWVAVTLSASAGARLPELSQLIVLYPGRSLMENLPAIYRRAEEQPGSFLRSLVGVLETTTQELDARIASMGSRIHPSAAPAEWLDYLARWLGVPWDDGLTVDQKRSILTHAPELATGRGTRRGLEALLESLMPGIPRRFRVTDATADFGFAVIGNALPAMLGGRTRWSAELDSRSFLGSMRLPCAGQLDDGAWQLAGTIRVEIAASAEERKAWEPWLLALITEMVPLTVRVELRWVSAHALQTDRLDGSLVLDAAPSTHLGTDAVTGLARLPERGARLSTAGSRIGTPLR